MSEGFDAYYTWLGIPRSEQPPDHYRLLGIKTFEGDPEVIGHAADRQMSHIRSFQAGPHSAASQKLLNELAVARICLLAPAKKAAYDAQLKSHRAASGGASAGGTGAGDSSMLDQYQLQQRLATSRTGEIFKARHRTMGRTVALKVLSAQAVASAEFAQRFDRKIKILAGLSHPNLVAAYEAGQYEGKHYLVMEYVDGQTLWSLVKARGPLPVEESLGYVLQAAAALGYAHAKGVVHRNVKPSNLMINRQGQVKVVGFGIAHVEEGSAMDEAGAGGDLTRMGTAMGTAEYVAPEQARNAAGADQRADVYSLGCTLYALLTGRPPYPGTSVMEILAAHRSAPIPSLRAVKPELPEALDAVCQRMLAKRPEDRYSSMEEVIVALQACAVGRVASLPGERDKLSFLVRGDTWANLARQARDKWFALSLVGLVVVTLLLIGWAFAGRRTNPTETAAVTSSEGRSLIPSPFPARGDGRLEKAATGGPAKEAGETRTVAPARQSAPVALEAVPNAAPPSVPNSPREAQTPSKPTIKPNGDGVAAGPASAAGESQGAGKPLTPDISPPVGEGRAEAAATPAVPADRHAEPAATPAPVAAKVAIAETASAVPSSSPPAATAGPAEPEATPRQHAQKSPHELLLPNTNSPLQAGVNGLCDYSPELVFVDAMKMAREWVFHKKGGAWGSGSKSLFAFDAKGYPTVIPDGQFAEVLMRWDIGKAFPLGQYVVLYEGTGKIDTWGGAKVLSAVSGRQVWDVSGAFTLRITATDPKDNIRNIRVVPAVYEKTYQQQPFMPEVLEDLKYYKVLRFMDWQRTNNSVNQRWADRRTPDNWYTQTGKKGVALEYACDVCNAVLTDCWVCVPHAADDDYVRNMARLIRDRLDGRLRVYVEYSNETWNWASGFKDQFDWCEGHAIKMGSYRDEKGKTIAFNGHHYYAKRSLEIWALFEREFHGNARLVRVLAGQAGNPWTFGQRLKYIQAVGQTVDAVASTNYYNGYATLEYIKRKMFDGSTPEGWVKALRDDLAGGIARWGDQFSGSGSNGGLIQYTQGKIPIITYEGGLNTDVVSQREFGAALVSAESRSGVDDWIKASVAFAGRPEMYELTQQYCDRWMGTHPSIYMLSQFTTCSGWGKYGCWGAFNTWKPLSDSHRNDDRYRHRGLIDWVKAHRVPNKAPRVSTAKHLSIRVKSSLQLSARMTDDHVRQIGRVNVYWSCVSVPEGGKAMFQNPFAAKTTVRFDTSGEYRLQISANDGWAIGYDEVMVDVKE